MRWFIGIAYRGEHYEGWQTQPHGRTLQDVITAVLRVVCREDITLVGSGRTDAGVHAASQVAHFDTQNPLPARFLHAVNAMLPHDIAITGCHAVQPEAHARYTAVHRLYRYCVHTQKDPLLWGRSYYLPLRGGTDEHINIHAMNEAANHLLGWNDYKAFAKGHFSSHTHCYLRRAAWRRETAQLYFEVVANRFLRGMVRHMAGNLLAVGMGKRRLSQFLEMLKGRLPGDGKYKLPPEGLYLMRVSFPREIFLSDPPPDWT